ncbi:MAG: membrane protein insertion efficiency factor YidD [Nitrospinae bacterium]|jgi:uncharacterized protein|nr:membrane protein insertion efficiency factor YidD [Nitrospinota bacterium]MDA1109197.1 membrane protein insertion efficiency factor YidD [Nitrospinota bacterium]
MINWFLIKIIRIYQKCVSPFLTPSCRFYPTCSEYSAQALDRFPAYKALGRIVVRLLKCHPYHDGGKDLLK